MVVIRDHNLSKFYVFEGFILIVLINIMENDTS